FIHQDLFFLLAEAGEAGERVQPGAVNSRFETATVLRIIPADEIQSHTLAVADGIFGELRIGGYPALRVPVFVWVAALPFGSQVEVARLHVERRFYVVFPAEIIVKFTLHESNVALFL